MLVYARMGLFDFENECLYQAACGTGPPQRPSKKPSATTCYLDGVGSRHVELAKQRKAPLCSRRELRPRRYEHVFR